MLYLVSFLPLNGVVELPFVAKCLRGIQKKITQCRNHMADLSYEMEQESVSVACAGQRDVGIGRTA